MHPTFTPGFDVAQLVFYAFVAFFVGLLYYLRREDRREGYPLEDDLTGRVLPHGTPLSEASPKSFHMPFGRDTRYAPAFDRDPRDIAARPVERFHGAPLVPTGDPLADGIGPAAWAERRRLPDLDWEGRPRIVRLSRAPDVTIASGDPATIGWPVVGMDKRAAGTIVDLWVDRPDRLVRYLVVALDDGREVLAPMAMAKINRKHRYVMVDALAAAQFAGVPVQAEPDLLTAYDEERIVAYFGGGYLYATPERAEPLL